MRDGERLVFGFMTGTSIDALDGSAVRVRGAGLACRVEPLEHASLPLGDLAARLRALASGEAVAAREIASLAHEFALLHVRAAERLRKQVGQPDLLAAHGQTVFHAPPLSWQLFNPAPLAAAIGAPVIHDLRAADLAHGGQGAPITPLADWVLFRSNDESRAIINLGGFCNVTILPRNARPEDVRGFDVCACNHVLDGVARRALGAPYDRDGVAASSGSPHAGATEELAEILRAQREQGRSLGSGDEAAAWAERWGGQVGAGADLAASAVEGVARVIGEALAAHAPDRLLLAGGGALNRALAAAIARSASSPASPTDEFGVPVSHREAVAIGVLAALSQDGVAITLPQVTCVPSPAPLAGCLTPVLDPA